MMLLSLESSLKDEGDFFFSCIRNFRVKNFLSIFSPALIMPAKRHVKVDEGSVTPRKNKLSQKRLDALIHIPNINTKLENLEQTPLDLSDSRTEGKRQELSLWEYSHQHLIAISLTDIYE